MRIQLPSSTIRIWWTPTDTYLWASRPNAAWPCSQVAGKRLYVELDAKTLDLLDYTLNGRTCDDLSADELNAIIADALTSKGITQ